MAICIGCEKDFTSSVKHQKYCSPQCRYAAAKVRYYGTDERKKQVHEYNKGYRKTEQGRINKVKENQRYRENHKSQISEYCKKRASTDEGKIVRRKARQKYLSTIKGTVAEARHSAKSRKCTNDAELYSTRVFQLHTLKEPCNICGKPYELTHGIDHNLAFCNGGRDEWSNYQPVCRACHHEKSKQDRRIFQKRKREKILIT